MGDNTQYIYIEFQKAIQCRNTKQIVLFCRMKKFQSDMNVINACRECKRENTDRKNINQMKLVDKMGRNLRYIAVAGGKK